MGVHGRLIRNVASNLGNEKLDNWRKESQCPEVECSLDLDYEMQYQSE